MRQILAICIGLTSILPADAGGCRVVKHVAAVEAVVPVVPVTAVVVTVPTYSYAYQPAPYVAPAYAPPQQVYQAPIQANVAPPVQAAVAAPDVCDCNTLLAELRALRGELRGLAVGAATSAATTAGGEAILAQSCAKCHAPGKPEQVKGGFDLVDASGKLVPLTLQQKRRIAFMVSKGQMPPPLSQHQPLTDAQKAAVLEFVK